MGGAAPVGSDGEQTALLKGGHDIEVERFAGRAGLLCAAQHRDLAHGGRQLLNKVRCAEGAVEVDVDQTVFFIGTGEQVFADRLTDASHGDKDVRGIRRAVIVEQTIVGAERRIDFRELLFHNAGQGIVERVSCLPRLEKDVRTLGGAVNFRMMGMETVLAEAGEGFRICECF